MSTIWAVTDFTRENGATQIVPGSHLWEKDRIPTNNEIAYAEMKAGSVLLYTGTVLHGGGENISKNDIRTGIFLHYALNWLRQEENQYLSCPPEIAKGISHEIRSLIGYSKGGYVLGFYSDPSDKNAEYESVSPENMFTDRVFDEYSAIPNPDELVQKSTK
jgi:ectoine hydroxylase-related dioxygenase (phytanoyl-CoA dioxygenase family)